MEGVSSAVAVGWRGLTNWAFDKYARVHNAACDASTIDRYLRARQGDVKKAAKLLHGTLKWREEFNVGEQLSTERVAPQEEC